MQGPGVDPYAQPSSSGGPSDVNNMPQQINLGQLTDIQGLSNTSQTITATVAGDMQLNCAAGVLKLLTPGKAVKLTGGTTEWCQVAWNYIPIVNVTQVPLSRPLVQAGNTTAIFNIFGNVGPGTGSVLPSGILPFIPLAYDVASGNFYLEQSNAGIPYAARLGKAIYSLASVTTSGSSQSSGNLSVSQYAEIGIDITTTAQAGTSPTIQYFFERKGADGIFYPLWQSAVLTLAANTITTSIGAGMAYNQSLGLTARLRWVIGGSATPTYTHSANIYGK
jgi:hypothetical protein